MKRFRKSFRNTGAGAAFWIFLFFLSLSSAGGQAIRSFSSVGHLKTDSFDIFYAESLSNQAYRLASFADACLGDLEGFFGFAPIGRRIPVLLSDIQGDLNGYSIPYPANRIVMYLNGARTGGELSSLEDELYSVFIHELTHTLTLNARSPFWAALAVAAGDFIAPAAWIAPNLLVEGTAVWVESRTWPRSAEAAGHGESGGLGEGGTIPSPGRLNDPAALEPVALDLKRGERPSLWDLSGVADYPGSGSMPYLYGGLFSSFMAERYGEEAIPALWRKASAGNIFKGFDGTFYGDGILGEVAGKPPTALWDDFLAWAEGPATEEGSKADPGIGAAGGRVGAFATDGTRLYYVDLERQGVFSLDLSATGRNPPTFLFPADGAIESLSVSDDGESLDIDWIRQGPHGELLPAAYSFSLEKKRLRFLGDREVEAAGAAMENLRDPAAEPFLHQADKDLPSGYVYGLIKLGTRSMPARVDGDGSVEVLDSPLVFVRSISPRWRRDTEAGGLRIALSAVLPGGISKLAVLREESGGWKLYLQKEAPEGGVHRPVPFASESYLYLAYRGEGVRELRMAQADEEALSSAFVSLESAWRPLREMRKPADPVGKAILPSKTAGITAVLRPTLFPSLLASSRYPYVDTESAGLVFTGSDLTERLAWKSTAGWNFPTAVPEASIALQLSVDSHSLSLAAADRALPASDSTPASRLSGVSLGHFFYRLLLPVYRYVFVNSTASLFGLQSAYAPVDYFSPSFDYTSVGGSVAVGYSSIRKGPFAPFDQRGLSLTTAADYETLPGLADAFSFSCGLGAALPKPALKISLFGSLSPGGNLRFRPAGRYFSVSGAYYPSALAATFPDYMEYGALSEGSSWYLFGEAKLRLATIETGKRLVPVRLPFLPSWTLRRVSLWTGLRAAALDSSSALALPASAFAKAEFDFALLAGLAAEGHIKVQIEGAWAFSPSLAGGKALHFDFGLGATL